MDRFERMADGKALDEIRTTPGFMALERMIRRMREDAIEELASNPVASRKETKGKLAVLDQLISSVDEEIAYVRELARADEETIAVRRSMPLEGLED